MKVVARFVTPFLEDVYFEAIKRARFRRVLRRTKKVLHQILKSCEAPKDLKQLTQQVQDELCKQGDIEESDMVLVSKICELCFKIRERGIDVGQDLSLFVYKIEEQIERLTEEDPLKSKPEESTEHSTQPKLSNEESKVEKIATGKRESSRRSVA